MPIPCFMIDPVAQAHLIGTPGAMWFQDLLAEWEIGIDRAVEIHLLSEEYRRDWHGRRLPLTVCLPVRARPDGRAPGITHSLDAPVSGSTSGWTVTGDAPLITVAPSINYIGYYHGWLQDGVLSDDLGG